MGHRKLLFKNRHFFLQIVHFHVPFCLFSLLSLLSQPSKMGLGKIGETRNYVSLA